MTKSHKRGRIDTPLVCAAAATFLAACTSQPTTPAAAPPPPAEQAVYCVVEDPNDNSKLRIVEDNSCNDEDGDVTHHYSGSYVFITDSHSRYPVGGYIPRTATDGRFIRSNDPTSRTNAGLPATGKVPPKVTFSNAGIGSRSGTVSGNPAGGGSSQGSSGG